jgi:hypothetical protein
MMSGPDVPLRLSGPLVPRIRSRLAAAAAAATTSAATVTGTTSFAFTVTSLDGRGRYLNRACAAGERCVSACKTSRSGRRMVNAVPFGELATGDVTAHREDELADDRQTEARADLPVTVVAAVEEEAIERARQLVRRDSGAGVGDCEAGRVRH